MPAVSQAQRAYMAIHMGPEWMRQHHFNNKGPLPAHVKAKKRARKRTRKAAEHGEKE